MSKFKTTLTLLFILFAFSNHLVLAQSGGTLSYGDEVNGTISDADPVHRWTFEGNAGETITISMEATDLAEGGLDSFLQLLDANDEILAENDDASGATVNAKIEAFTLPDNGEYTIIASRFGLESGLAVGEYTLTLTLAGGAGATPETPTNTADVRPIQFDTPVAGTLNRQNFEDLWSFDGEQGDVVSIQMHRTSDGSDLDTFLRLLDSESRELARNDDGSEGFGMSEILNFELPAGGTYTIAATRYGFGSGTSSGDYTLEITHGTASTTSTPQATPTVSTADALPLTYGDFAQSSLTADQILTYSFEGQTGEPVTISIKRAGGDLDPSVALLDESSAVLAENDQFNGAADARIVAYPLPADGTYVIAVSADGGTNGDFVLHVFSDAALPSAAATPTAAPPPPQTIDISTTNLAITLSWEGAADFDLTVTDPGGNVLNYSSSETASGGKFGGDANGGCTSASPAPSETVYWETDPPSGDYKVEVAFVFPCDAGSPVSFTVSVALDGEVVETIEDELNEGEAITYDRVLE